MSGRRLLTRSYDRFVSGRSRSLLALGAVIALACGCGGERDFDAASLVAEMNVGGAGLNLKGRLDAGRGAAVTAIGFDDRSAAAGDEPPAGAVAILDGADAARAEFARCEAAVSFICFRVANAVLRFSNINRAQLQQVTAAVTRLEDTGS